MALAINFDTMAPGSFGLREFCGGLGWKAPHAVRAAGTRQGLGLAESVDACLCAAPGQVSLLTLCSQTMRAEASGDGVSGHPLQVSQPYEPLASPPMKQKFGKAH